MSKQLVDNVEHPDNRTIREKIHDDAWQIPKRQSDLPYAAKIAAKEAEIAERRFQAKLAAANVEEKELLLMKREQEKHLDKVESEKILAEHLASPRISRKLAEAKSVRQQIVSDPERTVSDIQNADRTIAVYSDPEGDHQIADTMLRALHVQEKEYRLAKANIYKQQAIEAKHKFDEIMAGFPAEPTGERIRVEGTDTYSRIDSLASKMSETPGYSLEDLAEVQRARRSAVLETNTALAEAALAKYSDTSPSVGDDN